MFNELIVIYLPPSKKTKYRKFPRLDLSLFRCLKCKQIEFFTTLYMFQISPLWSMYMPFFFLS